VSFDKMLSIGLKRANKRMESSVKMREQYGVKVEQRWWRGLGRGKRGRCGCSRGGRRDHRVPRIVGCRHEV